MTIPESHVLLGTRISNPSGFWIAPTHVSKIDRSNIRNHVLSVDVTGPAGSGNGNESLPLPSEFREGLPADIGNIDFKTELASYIQENGLETIFGVDIIEDKPLKMIEFSFQIGNILLGTDDVNLEVLKQQGYQFKLLETAWRVKVENGLTDNSGEVVCVVTSTAGHLRVTDTAKGLWDVVESLRSGGFLSRGVGNVAQEPK